MKVLVYGFEPYGFYRENISKIIVEMLPNYFRKKIFPTKFDKKMFLKVLNYENPDVIIGLGQHPKARKIRIERVGKNLYGKKMENKIKITENGNDRLNVSLKLKSIKGMRVSYDAGVFVCNYSIYVCQEWANKKKKKFAFMHIPKSKTPI